jgi:DNA-directed RNA polymerase subunit RPC12/RpoP
MTLTEKVAYLKGLAEGLNLDKDAKETKLFEAMFDILEDMALTVNDIDEDLAAVEELVDCIDEDLDELEDIIYDDDCDCDCGCGCDDDFDCDCGDELYEVECPSCGEAIYLDESMFDEEYIECPECGEKLELDIDFEDCDCDCDCDCCDDED